MDYSKLKQEHCFVNYLGGIVMGKLGKALDALLSDGIKNHSTATKSQSEVKQKDIPAPENLTAMDLVYAVYSEEGEPLVGSPSAGFAYFVESTDTLVVVSADSRKVRHVSLDKVMATDALDVAQGLAASFMVYGNQVVCNIKGVSQAGSNYAEAALRAILASIRLEKSEQADQYTPTT